MQETTRERVRAGATVWTAAARIIDLASDLAGLTAGLMAVACALIVAWGTLARYVLNHPTMWEMGLTTYLLISFGFLSASYGFKENAHVRVDILLNHLSARTRNLFEGLGDAFVAGFALVYVLYGWRLFNVSFRMKEVDPVVPDLPVWPVKGLMVLGVVLLGLQALRSLGSRIVRHGGIERPAGRAAWDRPAPLATAFVLISGLGVYALSMYPTLGLIILLACFLFAGVPVAFGLGAIGAIGLALSLGPGGLVMIPNIGYGNLNSFVLVALPLFILAGQIIQTSGLSEKIFAVCRAFIGHIPGGVGAATILSCGIFAAISGSSVANAAAMGVIAIPQLIRLGYNRRLAYGLVAAGGTLGILIPPSAGMILFGVVTEESIGRLFMAGFVPGLILMVLLMAAVVLVHRLQIRRQGRTAELEAFSWSRRWLVLRRAWVGLMLPVIILGGLYTGVFTATETAAVAVVYALVLALFSRGLKGGDWLALLRDSTRNISMILMIFVGAMILGGYVTSARIPQLLTAAILDAQLSKASFIILVMLLLLVMGMFMEAGAITLVTVPILYPILLALEINPIWFAVIMVINMEVACISPPVGLNLYIIQRVVNAGFLDVIKGTLWFMPVILIALILVLLVPSLALWLPGHMG